MSRYLYGASVQGIQEFIFKTNQLQEIVGASEIVKSLEVEFENISGYQKGDKNILLNAAGNVKAIFEDEQKVQNVVKKFPKKIMQKAYGITISQAVVKMEGKFSEQKEAINEQKEAINELEKRLKIQRNKPSIPLDLSINIMELAPKTARPLFKQNKKQKSDVATTQKRDAYAKWFRAERKKNKKFVNLKELSQLSNSKSKLAVIHADGNGLGQLIPKLSNISEFSVNLDNATKDAYREAKKIVQDNKIRKIILDGDDMTVICDASYALEFTKVFLEKFEELTEKYTNHKLTACAGIAYCNEKYPFHYAVSLAEALCSATKKHAKAIDKDLAPSSLMFHNIQSSNFQSWEKFIEDELTITNDKEEIRCDFGPYYLNQNGEPQIANFLNTVEAYRCEGSPISRLREWIGELGKSQTYSDNLLKRINKMASQNSKWNSCAMKLNLSQLYSGLTNDKLDCPKDKEKDCHGIEKPLQKTPIYDVLQILSVTEAK
ncbi:hypothetical protein [Sulfurimonas sp. RIFOXYB12_FULL_35_9]|uniref:Cas10/Cmr2 second palm domain-containing protein n=1 Tax=Sulfurimonas sp. RIFOXYB12_FULL_35_9 TaxID=1802256 RepID=UPI000B0D2AAF|nr:hypothetical protein [Sulfurimonas sp. RIFOXYB12_FULL_35_9]